MDVMIRIVYHFGGKWENNGGVQYVGGSEFKKEFCYDIDRFGYWDIHDFYANVLKIKKFRMWFRMSNIKGDDGLIELLGDNEVMQMVEFNKKEFVTNVYCVEEGDEITNIDEFLPRLETDYLDEDVWSEDGEDTTDCFVPVKVNMVTQFGEHDNDGENGGEDTTDCFVPVKVNMVTQFGDHDNDDEDYNCENEDDDKDDEEDTIIDNDNDLLPVNNESEIERADFPFYSDSSHEDGKVELCKGMKFKSVQIYRNALRAWNVERGSHYRYTKNTKERVTVICRSECGFKVHASVINDEGVFQIKTWLPNHACPRIWNNKLVTTRFIVDTFLEDFRDNPKWDVKAMQKTLQKKLSANVSIQQCYKAKRMATSIINGDDRRQYLKLRDYADAILRSNNGSKVTISIRMDSPGYTKELNPGGLSTSMVPLPQVPMFRYMYVRFAAQKGAFHSGLRHFIGLDGCFLKGVMGGQLLSAVAKDGNENMYPLAYAVVDAEDKASWGWFLQNLIDDFGHPDESKIVFMSDKQKGLQEAMNHLMPGVEHRICVKHLYENFKVIFKGQEFKGLLWEAASTGSRAKWATIIEKMKKLPNGNEAVNFLLKNDPRSWARSHFSTDCKTDLIVNNISESFNAAILHGRDMPILSMLEWIRRKLMKRIYEKNSAMEKWNGGNLCPNIVKAFDRIKEGARNYFAIAAGHMKFEVDYHGSSAVVDINAKTCTCSMWDLKGIPCIHAVVAIYESRLQPEEFVDPCYSVRVYKSVYSHFISPLPSRDEWPVTNHPDVHPPRIRKPTGRPKKKRRKGADESTQSHKVSRVGGEVRCGNCKQVGHNSRGCKAAVTGETLWQRRRRMEATNKSQTTSEASIIRVNKSNKQQRKKLVNVTRESQQSDERC